MSGPVLLALGGLLAFGLALVWLGWRGRRLDDHPVCRACRFDLVGVYPAAATCPECGANLKRDRAVRHGQRRRRPLALVLGALCAALPVLAAAALLVAVLSGTSLHRHKPLALLLLEARFTSAEHATTVAAELHRRQTAGALDKSQEARVMAAALQRQGDPSRPWAETWGDIIEQGRLNGTLPKEDHDRFKNQAPVLKFEARTHVRAGDPIPVVISVGEARIGGQTALISAVTFGAATLDGKSLELTQLTGLPPFMHFVHNHLGWLPLYGRGASQWHMMEPGSDCALLLNPPTDVAPGRYRLELAVDVKTTVQSNNSFSMGPATNGLQAPDVRTHAAVLEVVVVPAGQNDIELLPPTEEMTEQLETLLQPRQAVCIAMGGQDYLYIDFAPDSPPVPFAFEVFGAHGGREVNLGLLCSHRAAGSTPHPFFVMGGQHALSAPVTNFRHGTIDLILRPSLDAAHRTVGMTRIYGGEVVIKGVAVQNQFR